MSSTPSRRLTFKEAVSALMVVAVLLALVVVSPVLADSTPSPRVADVSKSEARAALGLPLFTQSAELPARGWTSWSAQAPSLLLAQEGIYGLVTANGNPVAGIPLELRRYGGGGGEETVLTTTTDGSGNYLFTSVPTLDAGKTYYVLFRNTLQNPAYVWRWYGPDIVAFQAGQYVDGGDFDIGNIVPTGPANNSTQALPVTFTWTRRNVPADSYVVTFRDSEWNLLWNSGKLGYVDQFILTALPGALAFGQEYPWDMMAYMGPSSFGESYYYRNVTFTQAAATPTPTATQQIGYKVYLPVMLKWR